MVVTSAGVAAASCARRPGFSLLEALVVLAALTVFLGLVGETLWAVVRIERSAAADFQGTLTQGAVADQFRADVAAASSAPKQRKEVAAGPQCLILQSGAGKTVIYRWDGTHLERSENAGSATTRQHLSLGPDASAVEFVHTDASRLVTLRLTETRGQGSTRHNHLVEIAAALGGDLQ